jgi:hypothetical protein
MESLPFDDPGMAAYFQIPQNNMRAGWGKGNCEEMDVLRAKKTGI